MRKSLMISIVGNIILLILLCGILNTNYQIKYCNGGGCFTTKQKIIDYMIGKE